MSNSSNSNSNNNNNNNNAGMNSSLIGNIIGNNNNNTNTYSSNNNLFMMGFNPVSGLLNNLSSSNTTTTTTTANNNSVSSTATSSTTTNNANLNLFGNNSLLGGSTLITGGNGTSTTTPATATPGGGLSSSASSSFNTAMTSSVTNTTSTSNSSNSVGPTSLVGVGVGIGSGGGGGNTSTTANTAVMMEELLPLVVQLTNPDQREGVLLELSKKRESFTDLAPILWHTYGTVAALLQEIVSIYPLLSPPTLTAHASNRVCNALALLQCVASHPDTRSLFLSAQLPLYLYPFLNTQSKSRPFEYLRLTSLGVIGALVKMDDSDVINFLLQTEIIPLCLRIMETGSELSKTVATFIVQKIVLDETGLNYVCATAERFYAVSTVLNNMVNLLIANPSVRLLKHIVRCYLRLSDNIRARDALKQCLPNALRDETFGSALREDMTVKKWLSQLLAVVGTPEGGVGNNNAGSGGGGNGALGGLGSSGMNVSNQLHMDQQ